LRYPIFYFLWTKLRWSTYWFSVFKKKIFYRFSGRIRTFYRRKTVQMNFVRPPFERCFQVRDFSFQITEWIGLTGVSFYFWPQKQIPSGSCHRNIWLLFHFHVKNLPIFMFLDLIWCKILCWAAELKVLKALINNNNSNNNNSILYGVWNATGSYESPKTEFVSHEIFISRVTLWGLKCNHKSWEPKNLNKF
jgi:hypothetical protein